MINWIKYDPANRPALEQQYLVTNGVFAVSAALSELPTSKTDWVSETGYVEGVTHYAHINLPGEDKADD